MFGAHYYIPCTIKQLTSLESSPQDPTSVNTCATLPESGIYLYRTYDTVTTGYIPLGKVSTTHS